MIYNLICLYLGLLGQVIYKQIFRGKRKNDKGEKTESINQKKQTQRIRLGIVGQQTQNNYYTTSYWSVPPCIQCI